MSPQPTSPTPPGQPLIPSPSLLSNNEQPAPASERLVTPQDTAAVEVDGPSLAQDLESNESSPEETFPSSPFDHDQTPPASENIVASQAPAAALVETEDASIATEVESGVSSSEEAVVCPPSHQQSTPASAETPPQESILTAGAGNLSHATDLEGGESTEMNEMNVTIPMSTSASENSELPGLEAPAMDSSQTADAQRASDYQMALQETGTSNVEESLEQALPMHSSQTAGPESNSSDQMAPQEPTPAVETVDSHNTEPTPEVPTPKQVVGVEIESNSQTQIDGSTMISETVSNPQSSERQITEQLPDLEAPSVGCSQNSNETMDPIELSRQRSMASTNDSITDVTLEDASQATPRIKNKSNCERPLLVSPMEDLSSSEREEESQSQLERNESCSTQDSWSADPINQTCETGKQPKQRPKRIKSTHDKYSVAEMAELTQDLDAIRKFRKDIKVNDESSINAPGKKHSIMKKNVHGKEDLPPRPPPVFYMWTYFTEDIIHASILKGIIALSRYASRNPWRIISSVVMLSFTLVGAGFFTNFQAVFDHEILFTPTGSLPAKHGEWVYDKAGFEDAAEVSLLIHSDGDNIMHMDAMRRTFEALDTLRETEGYKELCATSSYLNLRGKPDCWIWSTTQFWGHDIEKFNEQVTNDHDLIEILSQDTYPDGTPVYKEGAYGKHTSVPEWRINSKGENVTIDLLTYAPNFIVSVGLPDTYDGEIFQELALERLKELKNRWDLEDFETNPEDVKLEFFTVYAYLLEYERALTDDMPLVPLTFYVMLLFTCIVFHHLGMSSGKSPTGVEPSRFSLGLLSTFTIGMSLMSGYGLMFCIGIPFSNLAQMVPFIILGVGLDDTFIITGAYFRKLQEEHQIEAQIGDEEDRDENELITERIAEVMEEVGLSIALTTTTTTFAFLLGCLSTIPGIRWVCLYAGVTIVTDFVYQVTLFVAFLTLDERRMIRARQTAKKQGEYLYIGNIYAKMRSVLPEEEARRATNQNGDELIFTQRIMRWYANQLLRPKVKLFVLVLFGGLTAWTVWRTTLLTQAFNVEDYVPDDSYTRTFFSSLDHYSSIKMQMTLYFRDVNQSDPVIQDQMREYIAAMSDLHQIQQPPDACWVTNLHAYMTGEAAEEMDEDQARQAATIAMAIKGENRTFAEQLDVVLGIPLLRDVYGGDIVRSEDGEIVTSRCYLYVRHIDLKNITEQTQMLYDQRILTSHFQPQIDATGEDPPDKEGELSFFAFDDLFYYWELYTVAVDELVFTTISGVIAVNAVGFLLIPHWTAVLYIFPVIIMLYFNLLGTLQVCGVHINAVTYVLIVIAIGLLVDFLMHILLRYYESSGETREEKVKETLETMGASMLMGGFTTWLGVIPLSLSSTKIFNTIFVAFMAMISWGLLTSLILMPVILSLWGPIVCTIGPRHTRSQHLNATREKAAAKMAELKQVPSGMDRYSGGCDDDDGDSGVLDLSAQSLVPKKRKKALNPQGPRMSTSARLCLEHS